MYVAGEANVQLSFGVNLGEVFALIGINGAGKTTTFKMLTREEKPLCGGLYIRGMNVFSSQFREVRKWVGSALV